MNLKSWDAIATLVGAVVGAGALGLPFVMARAGIIPGLTYIIVLGAAILALHLMVGEVALRTNGDHQLTGYARLYVGKAAGRIMTLSMVVGVYGALLAYIIGMGASLSLLLGGLPEIWMLVTFVVMGILLSQRLAIIEKSERYLSALKILLIVIVSIAAFTCGKWSSANLSPTQSWTIPFGVVLFSLLGTAVIPEVREELKGNFRLMRPVLFWSSGIVVAIYILFALGIVGVTGGSTSEIATISLGSAMGLGIVILLDCFAVIAMASAFLALGEALKKTFEEDYGWRPWTAWATVMAVPAILILLGLHSFIDIIGITGALAGGLDGIVIVLMYRSARVRGKRKPEYVLNFPVWLQMAILAVFILSIIWVGLAIAGLL